MTIDPNVKVYKKIGGLDLLKGDLTGAEILPLSIAGKTYRRAISDLFGDDWFGALVGAFSAFKAPDATHADKADQADLASDASTATGISFVTGKGIDRWEEITIKPGAAWVIPSGSFLIYGWSAASISSLVAEIDDQRVPGSWGLRAPFPAGLVLSDGVSQRIRNISGADIGLTIRVLAHK